ncbi:MAG: aldehyde dehydrogenase family protein, partial [Bacteroidetes bacterium]|nr:aldehyde dehydrogenase family protein [Bacteroidota bacterium]
PAMMGNTVIWKPSKTQVYAANIIMEVFREAGLPAGVINLMFVSGPDAGEVIFSHPDFTGIHFTGSTQVFQNIWKAVGDNIHKYKTYPRIVGETGGKDFIIAHKSADAKVVATAISRGAFEYQGQKCSAASRAYIPSNIWDEVKKLIIEDIKSFKMGGVEDFSNFINAVIDEASFDNITSYIDRAKADADAEIIAGGGYDKSKGYFIEPTVIVAKSPKYLTMCEEIFGPVLAVQTFRTVEEVVEKANNTPYGLSAGVWTDKGAKIFKTTSQLRAGIVWANTFNKFDPSSPFGGYKESGFGREGGLHGLSAYLRLN